MKERYCVLSEEFPDYLIGFTTKEGKIKYLGNSLILYQNIGYTNLVGRVNYLLVDNLTFLKIDEVVNNEYDSLLSCAIIIELLKYYKNCKRNEDLKNTISTDEKKFLILYKNNGKFFTVYNYDAYILNYLFGYKVINNKKAGFPENALSRIIERIENEKISYQIIYPDKDPYVKDYKKINKYSDILEKAKANLEFAKRLDLIMEKLRKVDSGTLEKIIGYLEKI